MKKTLEQLHSLCSAINQQFGDVFVSQEELDDFIEAVNEDWDSSYEQLKKGLEDVGNTISDIKTSEDSEYAQGILDIFWGLRRLAVLIDDADNLLVAINKGVLYKNGDITLEDYQTADTIEVEYEDDNDN